jgi:hypothetical protein
MVEFLSTVSNWGKAMKKIIYAAGITLMMLLSACTTVPTQDIRVEADSDPKASFSGFKTYAWFAAAQLLHDPEGQWEPRNVDIDAKVQLIINRELQKRGIVEVNNSPDMLVAYAAGVDMTSLGLKENPNTKEKLLENIPKAALVIALIDADTGYVVWLAEAVGEVQEQADAATVSARIEYAVSEMFRLLPKN